MRLTRNKGKYAAKTSGRRKRWPKRYGSDGPECPYCCGTNGKFRRETKLARIHAQEMQER